MSAPTLAELRARLLALPGELRALGVAIARGELSPDVGDELGRLLDAEGEALAAVLAVCSPPRKLWPRSTAPAPPQASPWPPVGYP